MNYFKNRAENYENQYHSADGTGWDADGSEWDANGGQNWNAFGYLSAAPATQATALHPALAAQVVQAGPSHPLFSQAVKTLQLAPVAASPAIVAPKTETDMKDPAPSLIITVKNTSTSDVSNVELFNASALDYTGDKEPNYQNSSAISISSVMSNLKYNQILSNSKINPVRYGEFMLITETSGQIDQEYKINHTDPVTGQTSSFPYYPILDPYQTLTDRITKPTGQNFILDGNTAFVIGVLKANCTLQIRFFSYITSNNAKTLKGESAHKVYTNPHASKLLGYM